MSVEEFIQKYISWIFSGAGVAVVGFLLKKIVGKKGKQEKSDTHIHELRGNNIRDVSGDGNVITGNININTNINSNNEDRFEDEYREAFSLIKVNKEAALEKFEKILDGISSKKNPKLFVDVKSHIGMIYGMKACNKDKKDNSMRAINSLQEALNLSEIIDDNTKSEIYTNMGHAYCMLGEVLDKEKNTKVAIQCYCSALEQCDEIKYKEGYGQTLSSLANAYRALSIVRDRKENLLQSMVYFERAKNYLDVKNYSYGILNHNIAIACTDLYKESLDENYLYKAQDAYDNALKVFTIENYPDQYALMYSNKSNLYRNMYQIDKDYKKIERAIECCKEALKIKKKETDPQDYALCMRMMGNCYAELFNSNSEIIVFEKALKSFEDALEIYTIVDFPMHYSYVQKSIGDIYKILSKVKDRKKNLQKAIECYDESLKFNTEQKYPNDFFVIKEAKTEAEIWLGE